MPRSRTDPETGQGGGSGSGSSPIRRCPFQTPEQEKARRAARGHGTNKMAEAFRGEFDQKVDGKARVSIPSVFRRVLMQGDPAFATTCRARLIVVYGGDNRRFCEVFTIDGMKKMERRIARLPINDPDGRRAYLSRNYITLSQEIDIDDDGRFVLPPKVRAKIGLSPDDLKAGAEAVFAGDLETFQIWKADTYVSNPVTVPSPLAPGQDMRTLLPPDEEDEAEGT